MIAGSSRVFTSFQNQKNSFVEYYQYIEFYTHLSTLWVYRIPQLQHRLNRVKTAVTATLNDTYAKPV